MSLHDGGVRSVDPDRSASRRAVRIAAELSHGIGSLKRGARRDILGHLPAKQNIAARYDNPVRVDRSRDDFPILNVFGRRKPASRAAVRLGIGRWLQGRNADNFPLRRGLGIYRTVLKVLTFTQDISSD